MTIFTADQSPSQPPTRKPDAKIIIDSGESLGCIDLRPWAKAHRFRYRFEESYKAESNAQARGDGRWYVEILCRNGLIYPYGGRDLLAYATRGVKRHIAALRPDIQRHQSDGDAQILRFPFERLDDVAAILRPRKRRTVIPTARQLEALREGRNRLDKSGANGAKTHQKL